MILPGTDAFAADVLHDMQRWLDRAVIGLNLCPFAKGVVARGQVHWAVSDAQDAEELLADLEREVTDLLALPPERRDTSLLVAPQAMADFLEFHAFQLRVDRWLRKRRLEGILQVASFHPQFEFADEPADAVGHFTNRAPHPTLHLLREDSVERAVQAFPDAASIYGRNLETLSRLGRQGWQAMGVGASARHGRKADAAGDAPAEDPPCA